MKIHEYQAKKILSECGIPIPVGTIVSSPEDAATAVEDLGGKAVIKAQVHAGGRGKAGGVKVVSSPKEARDLAKSLLGNNLVTFQTGPEGVPVNNLLIEELVDIETELYLGMVIDGSEKGVVAIASEAGGVDIEAVANETPEKILRTVVDPVLGLQPYQGRHLAYSLNIKDDLVRPISALIGNLYKAFESKDFALAEINPLVITADNRILALDAKLSFDDDAMFRHSDLVTLHDPKQEDPLEILARKYNISYVKLEGDVGCMVNGAGLAMATMDVVLSTGAQPANFLDVGGGADEEKISKAIDIILSDANVKRILINIFGGIVRCDVVARGIIMAAESTNHQMPPMVVRMLGTNADEGLNILKESSLSVTLVNDLKQAASEIKQMV